MYKKISIIIKLVLVVCLAISVSALISPKSVYAGMSTVDGWFSTTMTLENKISYGDLINGDNLIADITLIPSHDDEMQLRDFKITCNNTVSYDFNMSLRIKGGNELGTALSSSGDFGYINHEFTNALYLEVIAENITGMLPPYDSVVQCNFNDEDVELKNLLTEDIYHPNTTVPGNPEITFEIETNQIYSDTKDAEILKFTVQSEQDFELNQLQIECSSDEISNVELYDYSDYSIWNNNSVSLSNFGFLWAKKGFLFSSTILIPKGTRNYSIRADIPEDMDSQAFRCGISAKDTKAKMLSGVDLTLELGPAPHSRIDIVNKQDSKLEASLDSNNPLSSTVKKGLSDFTVLWLELFADSQQDLTMYQAAFEKFGSLDNNDIERVYLFNHQRQLLAEGNISANNRIVFANFNNVIKQGETHNLILSVAISQDADELKQFGFSFISASVLDEDKDTISVSGLPIKGNTMMIQEEEKSITITSPNGGEQWTAGSRHNITWNWTGDITWVKVMVVKDGVKHQEEVIQNTGSYSWIVHEIFEGSGRKVRIESLSNSSIYDESNSSFTVAPASDEQSITVTYPSGGEKLQRGKTYSIKWSSNNVESVWIKWSPSGHSVVQLENNPGYYNWTVPSNLALGDNYKIEVVDPSTVVYDWSDNFSIVSAIVSVSTPITPTPTVVPTPSQTLPEGSLVKLPNDPKIYVIQNGQRKWIRTAEEFQQKGYQWSNVQETTASVVNAYAEYLEATSKLIRAVNESKVYKIINNKKLWIPTAETFNKMGNKWEDVQIVPETQEKQYPRLRLVKLPNDPKVYYLTEGGYKKHIPTAQVFNSYKDNKWEDIVEIEQTDLNAYPDVMLIRAIGGAKVYKLENGVKRWIKTANAFNRLGLNWDAVAPANATELNSYSEGGAIE